MIYKFFLTYTPTDPEGEASQRECSPLHGDDLSVAIDMEADQWYRKRKLESKLTFVRGDYGWIMARPFDGTFKLSIQSSTDGGATWQNYLEGTFSRANLEIDEDNQSVMLDGLNEGGEYNIIENGKDEEYDLMKVIPDSEAKEVQGQVHPALAMVDYNNSSINHSDIFCDAATTAAGYDSKHPDSGYNDGEEVTSDDSWLLMGIYAEAKVEMKDAYAAANGLYCGILNYRTETPIETQGGIHYKSIYGYLYRNDNSDYYFEILPQKVSSTVEIVSRIHGFNINYPCILATKETYAFSPAYGESGENSWFKKVSAYFHYIRATLLTQSGGNADNVLDTGDYYKRMAAFNNQDGGLSMAITTNTVEQPNGHRIVPGTGDAGSIPQYFAPPDETNNWIPLAEDNWQYASMWYTIVPSVSNGLLDPSKVGTFRWSRCWTLGTCIKWLLKKITNNKVVFDESVSGSEFLYSAENPVTQGEPFEYLFTQKSNVMRPSNGGESAARCIVRLDWFLDFLRNALNCYWWLEERNGGTYAFRVEHVEWFRRGGSYTGQMNAQFNLTEIKTLRNFIRRGVAAKRLDDDLHKYSYEMSGMSEKYTFSWQGDGGSDDFKGNPMFFKAGWIEKGTSESHEVNNVFADLAWLMLNAGSEVESSKNYDGLFAFAGYRAYGALSWRENSAPVMRYPQIATGSHIVAFMEIWLTAPEGQTVTVTLRNTDTMAVIEQTAITGTGHPQMLRLMVDYLSISGNLVLFADFGADYRQVTVHRVHAMMGNIYNVPNVENRLGDGYLQNGALAWPWLQCEYLHYDVPAQRWGFRYDDTDDLDLHDAWETDGTVKLRKKQDVSMLPLPTKSDEEKLAQGVIGGLRDSQQQLQTGIVKSATINLGTRNAKLVLMYDMIS